MLQTLRVHGGYAGSSDDALLAIPYARFAQAARVAAEARADAQRDQWHHAAFIGWQNASAAGGLEKGTTFGKYLKRLGLHEETRVTREQLKREKAAAASIGERVRDAFKGGVKKVDI